MLKICFSFGRHSILIYLTWLFFLLILTYTIAVPYFSHVDPSMADFSQAGLAPNSQSLFGTDSDGHDLFVRIAEGLRVSLFIALVTSISSCILGAILGAFAGMSGGRVDQIIMRLADAINSLPHLLTGIVIVALFKGSVLAIITSLVLTHWISIARVVRAQIIGIRHAEYIEAAWLSGMSRWGIMRYHFIPAAFNQAFIGLVLLIPHTIWHESTLSFLGLGLPPHLPSLGTLLSDAQGAILLGHWWILLFPCLFLIGTTMSVSIIGHHLEKNIVNKQEFF